MRRSAFIVISSIGAILSTFLLLSILSFPVFATPAETAVSPLVPGQLSPDPAQASLNNQLHAPEASLGLDVNYGHDWVVANTDPFATVAITVGGKAAVVGTADGGGQFRSWEGTWLPNQPEIAPGDVITGSVPGAQAFVDPVGTVDGVLDLDADVITGNIHAAHFAPTPLTVTCQVWADPFAEVVVTSLDPDGGQYVCDFSGSRDIGFEEDVAVMYREPDGDTVMNVFNQPSPELRMMVNYGHDWVEGSYEAGHTVWLTVTESDGTTVKGTAALTTGPLPWWGGQSGFSTSFEGWSSGQPDLQPGDWVYGRVDNGYTDTLRLGDISGQVDLVNDILSGTLDVPWLAPLTVAMQCSVWEPGGSDVSAGNVDVDGGSYYCDFSGQWDMDVDQDFAVSYQEPDGSEVFNMFRVPRPDVYVQKDHIGSFSRPGGVVVYQMWYGNQSDAVATDVLITDTLPLSTTWAGDTSGVSPEVGATGVVTWHMGRLDPWESGGFIVTLDVDPDLVTGTGMIGSNCAAITTSTPYENNFGNNQWCAGLVDVWMDGVDLSIDKWANPEDPAAGQEMIYTVQWCNQRGAAVGPVWLTDTLPLSTTLVGWRSHDQEQFWTEVVTTGGQLVLYASGLPGDWCEMIDVTLLLDAGLPLGTPLSNHVQIQAAGDVNPDDNVRVHDWAFVGAPRLDLQIDKSVHAAVPIPGGWVNYFLSYENLGNSETGVRVTDTLPAELTFVSASWGGGQPQQDDPFPPATVNGNEVSWYLGTVPVGGRAWFHVQADISVSLQAGDTFTNCVTITGDMLDQAPADNDSCYPLTLNPAGPNLSVSKSGWWQGDNRLYYQIRFANSGDTDVSNVRITDTIPLLTHFSGEWWLDGFDNNRIVNFADNGGSLVWEFDQVNSGEIGWLNVNIDLDQPGTRMLWYTNTAEMSAPAGDVDLADNRDAVAHFSGGEVDEVNLWVDTGNSNIWGQAEHDTPVTVTTPYTQVTAWADGGCGGCWDVPNAGPVYPGDAITVTAGAGLMPVELTVPAPFTAAADSGTDRVWGQIDHLDQEQVSVDLYGYSGLQTQTDQNGFFTATFPDIPRGGEGEIRYQTTVNYASVHYRLRFTTGDLLLRVNYEDDAVDANYEPGHTGWVTVTESDGTTIKATMVVTTAAWPWWGGGSGFSTHHHAWSPQHPDMQPGDYVFATMDNGKSSQVRIGTISGNLDVDADTITGTVDVPWLSGLLNGNCHVWAPGGPSASFMIDASGGQYSCDFGSMSWDVLPNHTVAIEYEEPDGDWVQRSFRPPLPNLHISKWADGEIGEGGNQVFHIQYWNDGEADAPGVVISDTMLGGLTYLSDTSGLPHTGSGSGPIAWQIGLLPAGADVTFDVLATHAAAAGTLLTNSVQITGSSPYDQGDPGELWSWWGGRVQPNNTWLNLGKGAWTEDPVPGGVVVFHVTPCNNGSTASADVTLTETLHPSMTLQTWWAQEAGWIELSSSAHELVLARSTIGGGQCGNIYLRATVSAAAMPGMTLTNTAVSHAANDLSLDDDRADWWGSVGDPHTNLSLYKEWNWGQLVPGGEIRYNLQYYNGGNVPVGGVILITDTLPISTTFLASWQHDQFSSHPITPAVGAGSVVWTLDGLENGYGGTIEVALQIDPNAAPGTILTNTAEILPQPQEDSQDDNQSSNVQEVYPPGPNLRLEKIGQWNDQNQLNYAIRVENIGTEPIWNVTVTDTYPVSTTFNNNWWHDYWQNVSLNHYPGQRAFVWTVEQLDPGWSTWLYANLDLTGTAVSMPGLIFTNTAVVAIVPGEVNSRDNMDTAVQFSGPDLYVEKRLVGGHMQPGELVTFSLRFGNQQDGNAWWWNTQGQVWLTDTLPAELSYVSALQQNCGWCSFDPDFNDGTHLAWNLGHFGTGHGDAILVTLRVTDTVQDGDWFTNTTVIASREPVSDTDPFPQNNATPLPIPLPTAPVTVSAALAGTELQLTWADESVDYYELWQGVNDPYLAPGGDCATDPACTIVAGTSYAYPGAAGDPANNPFVAIRSVRMVGETVVYSQAVRRSGAFTFNVTPGN